MVNLGDQIKALRGSRGWSARRLSDEVGGLVSRQVIADLENGRRQDLGLSAGAAIAKAFGITTEDLLDETLTAAIRRANIENRLAEIRTEATELQQELKKLKQALTRPETGG